jgi:hypothetical protein
MMQHCPSHDWDRYIAAQEGPMPVGNAFVGKSRQDQRCEACGGSIPAKHPHSILFYHDEDGHFMSPERTHLKGECRPFLEAEYNEWSKE